MSERGELFSDYVSNFTQFLYEEGERKQRSRLIEEEARRARERAEREEKEEVLTEGGKR